MTAAQKIAKEKFKKAIAYRQKTGVSLKEAFAHVYGKKTVTKKPTKYKSKLTKKWNPIKPTDNVKELKKYGYQLKGVTKKSAKKVGKVTLKKANYHPRDERYIIMNDGVAHLEAKPFFKSDATRIAKALRQVKAKRNKVGVIKRKTAKKKKTSEQSILNKIHRVKNEVNKLDEAQHKHMSSLGIVGSKLYNSLSDLKIKHKKENGHWFDRQTMKYFNTKVESALIGGKYFIYSNKMPLQDRTYQIAEAYPSGNIFPVENSPHFKDKIQAKKYLLKIVKH